MARAHGTPLSAGARAPLRRSLHLAGVPFGAFILGRWVERGFGELREEELAIVAGTCVVVGVQIIFTSLLLSILGLRPP